MTEDDTFAALKKITYEEAMAYSYELIKVCGVPFNEFKNKLKQKGWDTNELYERRRKEIYEKELFK